ATHRADDLLGGALGDLDDGEAARDLDRPDRAGRHPGLVGDRADEIAWPDAGFATLADPESDPSGIVAARRSARAARPGRPVDARARGLPPRGRSPTRSASLARTRPRPIGPITEQPPQPAPACRFPAVSPGPAPGG